MDDVILLIDGSTLAFLHAGKKNYKETVKQHILNLLNKYKTEHFLIILERSNSNFRNEVAKTKKYKAHRRTKKAQDNINKYSPYLKDVFEEIRENYNPKTYLGIENDDALGILSTRFKNTVIIGNDKDLLCIPGVHHNLRTNKINVVSYPGNIRLVKGKIKATGYFQVYSQVIKGSPKENYPGVTGFGDKKTYELLKDLKTEEEMQKVCTELFVTTYGITEGIKKLEEGFRLSWIILENHNLITPEPINYKELPIFD